MGIWSVTTVDAADSIQRQRWLGVLELLVAAPTPFWAVLLPITIASSAIGIYSLVSTLLWGRLVFGIPLELEQPLLFALAIPPTIVSIGLLGFVMASVIVRYRAGWAVGNMFEYPVWLVTGLLIPVALLPGWVEPISWVLAPTWGMRALSDAAFAGGSPLVDIAMCLAAQRRLHRRRRAAARPLPRVGAPPRDPLADVSAVRVALIGGLLSFRGLFNWLHPALFIPTLIVPPIFQMLFFAYLGRAAELESDTFYVVGNSIQLAALPGLFAMSQAIAGERRAPDAGAPARLAGEPGRRSSSAAACP